jgi:hypothetical protein
MTDAQDPICIEYTPTDWGGVLCVTWRAKTFKQGPFNRHTPYGPLGGLIRCALLVSTGHERAECSFGGEPYEWRWIVDHSFNVENWIKHFRLRILGFADTWARQPESEGELLFEAECDEEPPSPPGVGIGKSWTIFGPG